MSLYFISVNSNTNAIRYIGNGMPFMPDFNTFTSVVDDSEYGIKDLITNLTAHTFDVVMGGRPYVNVRYDGSNIIGTLMNTSNVPALAQISLFGTIYETSITNNQFVFPIVVHPCIADKRIQVTIKVEGFPYSCIEIGGSNGESEIQVYADENGIYNIIPSDSAILAQYWQNKLVDLQWSEVDLSTITGILTHALFTYVFPNLNITLTPEEQKGLNEIQTNILPLISTNLGNVISDEATKDVHYASYQYHLQQAKEAIENYMNDRNKILQYMNMK